MLCVGDKFPDFKLKACADISGEFPEISRASYPGKWLVVMFWPKDFTFVCPTEIVAFHDLVAEFRKSDAVVIGASTDTDFVHLAWRKADPRLTKIDYPWLADTKKSLANALGILHGGEGVAYRATFIVDPDGIIRHVLVNDLGVGRNPEETLRTLHALQNGALCPASWRPGQKTLSAA